MNLKAQFQKNFQNRPGQKAWSQVRKNAYAYFAKAGLPTKKLEHWKYTGLSHLTESQLAPAASKPAPASDVKDSIKSYLSQDFYNLVFIDGNFIPEVSDLKNLQRQVQVETLEKVLGSQHSLASVIAEIKSLKTNLGSIRRDAMEALNASFTTEGWVVSVAKNLSLDRPLHLIFFSHGAGAQYPRTFVNIGESSKVQVLLSFLGGSQASMTNSVTEIICKRNSHLSFNSLQDLEFDGSIVQSTRVFLSKDSNLESLSYQTGAALSRHNLDVFLVEENASARIDGLTLTGGKQHVDNHTNIEHIKGHGTTTQLYKSLLAGNSRAVFNGRVHIHPQAQKANSDQLNKNLLISGQAEADSKPELAIYADDVKATHGSTVGQLNAEEIFYFQSRAIPKDKAIELLSLGFNQEITGRISHPALKAFLNRHLLAAYNRLKVTNEI